MRSLSTAAILEKNKIASTGAEIVLLKVVLPDTTVLPFARAEDNVEWDGVTWQAWPFELGDCGEPDGGEVQELQVKIGNVSRQVQAYMEAGDGGVGAQVTLYVVNSNLLAEATPLLRLDYTLTGCSTNNQWATFKLGAPNLYRKRFPQQRISNNHCRYRRVAECKYVGSCNQTLTSCRAKGPCSSEDSDYGAAYDGSPRTIIFGGFPGAGKGELDA